MLKKTISLILVILLMIQMLPMSTFAQEYNVEELTNQNYSTEIGESYIIGEDTSKRDAYTKHFRCSDGRYIAASYSYPVHYEKDGQWNEYDFSLSESIDESGNTVYTGKDGQNYEIAVPQDIFSDALSYSYNGYEIKLTYQGRANQGQEGKTKKAKVSSNGKKQELSPEKTDIETFNRNYMLLDNASSTVFYEGVESDTNFSYTINAFGIKEDIVVEQPQNNYKYSYLLETGGLEPIAESNNSITLINPDTKELVYTVEAPVMYDSAGAESTDVTVKIKEKQGAYELIIEADKKWINSEDRVFPVTIDPTVRPDIDKANIDDTYVNQAEPSNIQKYSTDLYVGRNSSGLTRTYVKLNIPDLPEHAMIVSAAFSMFLFESDVNATGAVMNLYDLNGLESWTSGELTWNNQPVSTAENGANSLTVIDYCDYGTNKGHPYSWDITKVAKKWYITGSNNGVLIAPSDETIGPLRVKFLSSKSPYVANVGIPQLTVAYRDTRGLEDYWSYSSYSVGDAGTAYINDYNGNLVFVRNDVSTYGQRMPVTVSHIYNLGMANKASGYSPSAANGWQLSVQQSIKSTSDDDDFSTELKEKYPYVYFDGDGTAHYLAKIQNEAKYEDEDGLGLTMTINSSGQYVIVDNNDNKMIFNSSGNLISISDANSNTISLTYSGSTLTKVADGAGHPISFTNSGGNLASAIGPDGRICTYSISSGKLNSVTLLNGKTVRYEYDSAGRMTKAKASDGSYVQFAYVTNSQEVIIQYIRIYNSSSQKTQTVKYDFSKHNETLVEYSGNTSELADATKISTVKQFDDFGRLICTYEYTQSEFIGAANCAYVAHKNETDDTKHHVSTVGEASNSVTNYLLDPDFERSSSYWENSYYSSGSATLTNSEECTLFNKKSMKVNVTSYTAGQTYRKFQDIDVSLLTEGATYTASVYANVTDISSSHDGGVFLQAKTEVGSDNDVKYESEFIKTKTETSVNDGWQKLSVTFSVPEGVTRCYVAFGFSNAKGTAFFDGVQLEEGTIANEFNLIENSGFDHGNKVWSLPSSTNDGRFSTSARTGIRSYKVFGGPFKTVNVSQTINLKSNAKETDTYVLSAWAKAEALSNWFHTTDRDKLFGIGATVKYSDNTTSDKYISGNFAVNEWQYLCGAFTLSDEDKDTNKTPVSITVYALFDKQSNFAYFDDFNLAKEDVMSYTYNNKGNLVSAVDNAKGNQQMSYSANGVDMTQYKDAVSNVYNYTYDEETHNLTTATSTNGVKYNYSYDDYGNVTGLIVNGSSGSESISSSISYTDNNSLVGTTTDATGGTTTYTYLEDTGIVSSVKDARNNTTSYTYNATDYKLLNVQGTYTQKASMTATSVKTAKAVYSYDSNDNLINIKAKSNYSFTYDSMGNLLTAKAGDNLLVTNTYNQSSGALTSVDYGNYELYQAYTYDTVGRLVGLKNNGVNVGTWEYDGKDRISTYTDIRNSQKHLFTYDSLSRFIRESVISTDGSSRIYASEYSYDNNNNVDKIGVTVGNTGVSMTYTYGTDNLPAEYTAGTNSGEYTYDSLNRLKTRTSSITPTVTYNYALGTAMVSQESASGSTTSYSYDKNGNITCIMTGNKAIFYEYDELNRLVAECNKYTDQTTVYKYDAWGNIAMKWVYSGSTTFTPASENLIKKYDYVYSSSTEGMAWKDLMTKYDGQTITYDAIGNPTSYMGSTMYWEGRTLVEQIKNGTTITYSYDSSDMRTSKTVGGVKYNYYYVEGKLMYEDCPSYKLFYSYDANGFLSGIKRVKSNGVTENFGVHCNIFGDVISIYFSDGSLAATYTYDTWGKLLAVTDMTGNDVMGDNEIWTQNSIRYRGYVYDEETQLYYLQSRYYDPNTGRFINADNYDILAASPSSFTDKNLFSYCDNNPISRLDSNGQIWTTIGIMAVGGLIGAGISAATSYISQKIYNNNVNWKSVVVAAGTGFVSGAVGASPLGKTGQAIVGAIVSGVSYAVDASVNNTEIDSVELLTAIIIGGVSGRVTGGGANENLTITNSIDATRKAITRERRRMINNAKYAQKSINSLMNHTINDISIDIWKFSFEYTISDFASNVANNNVSIFVDIVNFSLQLKKLSILF